MWVNVVGSPPDAAPAIYEVGVVVVSDLLRWRPGASLSLPIRQAADWVTPVREADSALAERFRRNGLIRDVKSAPLDLAHAEQALADLVRPYGGLRLIVRDQATLDLIDHPRSGMRRKFLRAVGRVGPPIFTQRIWDAMPQDLAARAPEAVLLRHRAMFDLSKECERAAASLALMSDDALTRFWEGVEGDRADVGQAI